MGFWLGLAILSSVLLRSTATSALAALAVWILLAFLVPLGATAAPDGVAPLPAGDTTTSVDAMLHHEQVQRVVAYVSPMAFYTDVTDLILDPMRKTTRSLVLMGPIERLSISRFENPLPLAESALVVAPLLVLLIAATFACFGVCYACCMRQEIRTAGPRRLPAADGSPLARHPGTVQALGAVIGSSTSRIRLCSWARRRRGRT